MHIGGRCSVYQPSVNVGSFWVCLLQMQNEPMLGGGYGSRQHTITWKKKGEGAVCGELPHRDKEGNRAQQR